MGKSRTGNRTKQVTAALKKQGCKAAPKRLADAARQLVKMYPRGYYYEPKVILSKAVVFMPVTNWWDVEVGVIKNYSIVQHRLKGVRGQRWFVVGSVTDGGAIILVGDTKALFETIQRSIKNRLKRLPKGFTGTVSGKDLEQLHTEFGFRSARPEIMVRNDGHVLHFCGTAGCSSTHTKTPGVKWVAAGWRDLNKVRETSDFGKITKHFANRRELFDHVQALGPDAETAPPTCAEREAADLIAALTGITEWTPVVDDCNDIRLGPFTVQSYQEEKKRGGRTLFQVEDAESFGDSPQLVESTDPRTAIVEYASQYVEWLSRRGRILRAKASRAESIVKVLTRMEGVVAPPLPIAATVDPDSEYAGLGDDDLYDGEEGF